MQLKQLEYNYRKTERGLNVLLKYYNLERAETKLTLKSYGYKLGQLRKELYRRTGRTYPERPKWPV